MPFSPISWFRPGKSQPHKPVLVYVPGMDGTGQLLTLQLPGLEVYFEVRCLRLGEDDCSTWDDLAEQGAALIRTVGRRGVYVCGESFGGCLALMLAAKFPELVNGLVLVNPASAFEHRPWLAWGTPFVRLMSESMYRLSTVGLVPFLIGADRVSQASRAALIEAMQSISAVGTSWRLSLLRQFQLNRLPLHQVQQPTLIVASRADRLLPSVEEAQRLKRAIPQATVLELPYSHHACLLEAGVDLAQLMATAEILPQAVSLSGRPQQSG